MLGKRVSLDSLPPEVIEYILITAVAAGDAESVAAVAATCKYLFEIVYDTLDSHLWRSLFCTTFDDPRRLVLQGHVSDGSVIVFTMVPIQPPYSQLLTYVLV